MEKAWARWKATQPSLFALSSMRRSVACGDPEDPEDPERWLVTSEDVNRFREREDQSQSVLVRTSVECVELGIA